MTPTRLRVLWSAILTDDRIDGEPPNRGDLRLAVGVGLLFLIVRGAHLAWAWSWPLAGDAIGYDHLAWELVQGRPWVSWLIEPDWQFGPAGTPTAVRTPGLPLFLAAIYAVGGHQPLAGRVALVVVNALAAGLLLDTGRRMQGRVSGLIAALLWVFWPVSVRSLYYMDSLLGESLAIPAVIVAVWLLSLGTRLSALLAGVAAGFAILTRPHLALAIPIFGVFALVRCRQEWLRAFLLVLGVCSAVTPWTIRNAMVFGTFMPLSSQGSLGIWAGWVEGSTGSWDDAPAELALVRELARAEPELLTATEPAKAIIYSRAAREALQKRGLPGSISWGAWKAWLYVRPWETSTGLHVALLLCTILAAFSLPRSTATIEGLLCWSVWLGIGLTAVVTFYLGRYRVVSTPALALLSSLGVAQVGRLALRVLPPRK